MPQPRAIPEGIRSRKNSSGSTIGANLVVKQHTVSDECRLPGATTDDAFGVTMAAIPDGQYGDIQTRGQGVLTAGAAIAVGDRLMLQTSGKVITWTAGAGTNAAVVGTANTAAGADGDLIEAELAGPCAARQG